MLRRRVAAWRPEMRVHGVNDRPPSAVYWVATLVNYACACPSTQTKYFLLPRPCEPDCYGALLPCWLDTYVICNGRSSRAPARQQIAAAEPPPPPVRRLV